ncbi:MAG TPA: fumarate reductase/succinate dehydrogenase flavoprotein subunit, partial [Actinomycetes bacterium]|nr:fumarate reductase/succinate dehydrogenase flavoprotein subunit [Actinomycetes bacterium]
IHADLQQTMNDLVGIIRTAEEVQTALKKLDDLKERAKKITVRGDKIVNPGWHLALDLPNMLIVSECVARSALIREESRGGHTRDDFPAMSDEWRKVNLVCRPAGEGVEVTQQPLPVMPPELLSLFDREELSKYMTDEELAILPEEKKA